MHTYVHICTYTYTCRYQLGVPSDEVFVTGLGTALYESISCAARMQRQPHRPSPAIRINSKGILGMSAASFVPGGQATFSTAWTTSPYNLPLLVCVRCFNQHTEASLFLKWPNVGATAMAGWSAVISVIAILPGIEGSTSEQQE